MIARVIGGRFELLEEAGIGGMGTVYRASDRRTGGLVAVKVLMSPDARDVRRFIREAEVLSELSHPAIVKYIDHGAADDGAWFIAMEWLEGLDLADHLVAAAIDLPNAVALGRRLASGLAAAHAHGVIHRDIKPSNIFLVGGDIRSAKVLDFGIARLVRASNILTRTGVSMGTPGYMAPEQARGWRDIDARVDVFSLGCVLFEAIARRPAFAGEHVLGILAKILFEEAPRLSAFVPGTPPELDALIYRMLAKDPAERPHDGGNVSTLLETIDLSKGPAPTETPSTGLGRSEQRVVSVVVAASLDRTEIATPVSALRPSVPPRRDADASAIARVASEFEAILEVLADGSVLATLHGEGSLADQAVRAARFALALRRALPELPIVLATGRGVFGGAAPVGEVIDRAVRALRGTTPSTVAIDDVTAGLLDTRFLIGGQKGGHFLDRERPAMAASRMLLGKPTLCVGRERELKLLEATWAQCVDEPSAAVVLVTGPPGIGKSRLRHEFVLREREQNERFTMFVGRGDPLRTGAFSMLAPALRRAAAIVDGEPLEDMRRKLLARVERNLGADDEAHRIAEFLGEIAGVPFDATASPRLAEARLDAVTMGDRMKVAFERFIGCELDAHPVLVVLEDLQWGDPATLRFLERALDLYRARAFMVLALARPDIHTRFASPFPGADLTEIRLRGLSRKAAEELIRRVVKLDDGDVQRIIERADGNVFHLEELIRASQLDPDRQLPDTVIGMVQARLDTLEAEARRAMRAASVFGRAFFRGGVRALLGEGTSELDRHLAALVEHELIVERHTSTMSGEDQYVFRHDLVRDAAYAMLTDQDRRLGHRLAARWLEHRGESDAAVLAEHYELGDDPLKAAEQYERAAWHAYEAADLVSAVQRAQRGLSCRAEGPTRGRLELVFGCAEAWRSRLAVALAHVDRAIDLLPAGSADWFLAVGEKGFVAVPLGRRDEALAAAELVLGTEADSDEAAQARHNALVVSSVQLGTIGEYALAQRLLDETQQREAEHGPDRPIARARFLMARGFCRLIEGDLEIAIDDLEQCVRITAEQGATRFESVAGAQLGLALIEIGQLARGEAALRRAVDVAERFGIEFTNRLAKLYLAYFIARRGTLEPALLEGEVRGDTKDSEDRRFAGSAHMFLGEMIAAGGDLERGIAEVRHALELVSEHPTLNARAHASLSTILVYAKRNAEALEHAEHAMDVLRHYGRIVAGESGVRLAYVRALRAAGRDEPARAALREAKARLLETASRFTSERNRQRFLDAVPENHRILRWAQDEGV